MFFQKSNDKTALEQLIKMEAADRRRLAKMEGDFEALRPQWTELQQEAEHLASMYESNDRTYSRQISEKFWGERSPLLKARIEEVVKQRDALTEGREKEISQIKNQLHLRRQAIAGEFGAWVTQVSGQVPTLAADLAQARDTVQKSDDLRANVATVARCVEEVADTHSSIVIPMLSPQAMVRRALAIGAPAESLGNE